MSAIRRAGNRVTAVVKAQLPTWPAVLELLEGEVLDAQHTLARDKNFTGDGAGGDAAADWGRRQTDWIPPDHLGPLPDDLRERAARLLQHQLAVAEELVERITQSQRQRDVAARMSYTPSRPTAAFIDRPV